MLQGSRNNLRSTAGVNSSWYWKINSIFSTWYGKKKKTSALGTTRNKIKNCLPWSAIVNVLKPSMGMGKNHRNANFVVSTLLVLICVKDKTFQSLTWICPANDKWNGHTYRRTNITKANHRILTESTEIRNCNHSLFHFISLHTFHDLRGPLQHNVSNNYSGPGVFRALSRTSAPFTANRRTAVDIHV